MKLFVSELQYISELYDRLLSELSPKPAGSSTADATALAEAVLRNQELLSRVEQMNGRLSQLAKDWQSFREHLDPQSKTSIQTQAASVRKQAAELSLVIDKRARELDESRRKLEKTLNEVRQGVRYLASVKPVKSNYPKFVDSLG